jgi:hypothetical protein
MLRDLMVTATIPASYGLFHSFMKHVNSVGVIFCETLRKNHKFHEGVISHIFEPTRRISNFSWNPVYKGMCYERALGYLD